MENVYIGATLLMIATGLICFFIGAAFATKRHIKDIVELNEKLTLEKGGVEYILRENKKLKSDLAKCNQLTPNK